MQKEGQLKFLFVINPVSGGKAKSDWETQIRTHMRDSPHAMEFFLLTGDADETSVAHHIEQVQPDRVVAVGGDGTVKLVAELLQERRIPLGILPAGSANGMARELGIPLDPAEALKVVTGGQEQAIDLIRINDEEICIHLSDLGLNAMLVKYFEGSKGRGMWGYGRAIFRVLWQKQKIYATIHTEKGILKRKAYMIVLANARKYGTGANINPEGNVADGYFEVVVLRKLNLIEILKALFTNRSFKRERIEIISTRTVQIRTQKRTYFQVDGEYRGRTKEVSASILPGALVLLLPAP
ncbi:diacylglycerol kinase family protein [Flaviaesturariibacter amylovorans]|uniref:Diacylglycerol kinase family lipid kinase n=1 Tax=Flaviaesturariibacter amylovorans TaxID=1084520 RepID=A0ABP8GL24_9BACT